MTCFQVVCPAGDTTWKQRWHLYTHVWNDVVFRLTCWDTLYTLVWNDVVFRLCACWGVFIVQWCQKLSWHSIYTWCEMTLFSGWCLLGSIYSIMVSEVKLTPLYTHGSEMTHTCWGVFIGQKLSWHPIYTWREILPSFQVVCLKGVFIVHFRLCACYIHMGEMTLFSGCEYL